MKADTKKELVELLKSKQKESSNSSGKITSFYKDDESAKRLEEYDRVKTRLLKYIMYKKRTEQEVKNKFTNEFDEEILEDVIEDLKNLGYINDNEYIFRAINEIIALKSLSMKEIKYKLLAKGISNKIIEEYFSANYEELIAYEIQSAKKLVQKKKSSMEEFEIKNYLMKKGYKEESIKEALEER